MVVWQLSERGLAGPARGVAIAVIDVAMLAFTSWLVWRQREPWLLAMWVIQAVGIPLDLFEFFHPAGWTPLRRAAWWVNSVLSYALLAVLAFACVRRRFGPPYPVPQRPTAGSPPCRA